MLNNKLMHDIKQGPSVSIDPLRMGEGCMPQTGCFLCSTSLCVGIEVAVVSVKAGRGRGSDHVERDLFTAPESHAKREGIEDILLQASPHRLGAEE